MNNDGWRKKREDCFWWLVGLFVVGFIFLETPWSGEQRSTHLAATQKLALNYSN
jgi:hypothetical protein